MNQREIRNEKKRKKSHFHLYPLSFHETVLLKYQNKEVNLFEAFDQYLLHGGFFPAINDMMLYGKILESTLTDYADWIQKEIVRHRRNKDSLQEILKSFINNHYNNPITWNELSLELSINHPKTISDYIEILSSWDVLFVQFALLEKKLSAAPKKARKIICSDPFIFHALRAWLFPTKNIFETQIQSILNDSAIYTALTKGCVIAHYHRHYPTYYIKSEGEIDLAFVESGQFWPIVISWTNPLRVKDLKQIIRYPQGRILTKTERSGIIEHIRTEPLPYVLWKL